MAITILGPVLQEYPRIVWPAVIEAKRLWTDSWIYMPDLELEGASANSSANDLDHCTFRRVYGQVKFPHEAAVSQKSPIDLANWWIRVSLAGDQGFVPQWMGRVSGEGRVAYGADLGPSGVQTWEAYGPAQMLRKIAVGESYFFQGGAKKQIGWVPGVNQRHPRSGLVGNRSATKLGITYLYGGTDVWSFYDYVWYLLYNVINPATRPAGVGPSWTLGGQDSILRTLMDAVPMEATQSASEVLARLIPNRMGLDYKIVPTADGFELQVYSLSDGDWVFEDAHLPANPQSVEIYASRTIDNLRTHLAKSYDHNFQKIRLLGKRVVICTSIAGSHSGYLIPGDTPSTPPTWYGKWTQDLQDDYDAGMGTPGDSTEEHDRYRHAEQFRPVYQAYGAPWDWDFHDGRAAPLIVSGRIDASGTADYQNFVRHTLTWLPLREGWDYSAGVLPDEDDLSEFQQELRKPEVWIDDGADGAAGKYYPAEWLNVSVSVAQTDIGFMLNARPNHLLAYGYFPAEAKTATRPKYDPLRMAGTLAFESDQRLTAEMENPNTIEVGGTIDINCPESEMWILCPHTILDIDAADGAVKFSPPGWLYLRNDYYQLTQKMAGAAARYFGVRNRAEITVAGFRPWGELVGQILTTIDDGADLHEIKAVITSVVWRGGRMPTTTICTGYARRGG